jgi:hypothetical protein
MFPRPRMSMRRILRLAGCLIVVALSLVPSSGADAEAVTRGKRVTVSASTFFGGSDVDFVTGMALSPSGDLYVVGTTNSVDLPVKNAFQPNYGGGDSSSSGDVFVARFSSNGSVLEYATYLGGSDHEYSPSVAVDAEGAAYVVGGTASADFPLADPLQAVRKGQADGFVAKLDLDGQLVYSSYLGGREFDFLKTVALGPDGSIFVAGGAASPDFPTTPGAFEPESRSNGYTEAVIAKLSSDGQRVVYGSHIGGITSISANGSDEIASIAVDSEGCAYATGYTAFTDMPTVNAVQPEFGWEFVCKFSADGSSLVYSTYFGGSGGGSPYSIAVDAEGSAIVVGSSGSPDFPSVAPPLPKPISDDYYRNDGFVVKLSPDGRAYVYSGLFGGNRQDMALAVAVDAAGSAYIVGTTASKDLPALRPLQRRRAGERDAFFVKIDPAGVAAVSTYFGGAAFEGGLAVCSDESGGAFVAGFSTSPDFPIKRAVQRRLDGEIDAFVTRFKLPAEN